MLAVINHARGIIVFIQVDFAHVVLHVRNDSRVTHEGCSTVTILMGVNRPSTTAKDIVVVLVMVTNVDACVGGRSCRPRTRKQRCWG